MHSMLKKDFWYDLPKELIAQEPASPRDSARLMVLSQKDDSIQHKIFRDLPDFLEPGDLLVVNNSTQYDYISTCGMGQFYYTNSDDSNRVDDMLVAMHSALVAGDYPQVVEQFCQQLVQYKNQGVPKGYYTYNSGSKTYMYLDDNGKLIGADRLPFEWGLWIFIASIVGAGVALVVYFSIKSQYKFKTTPSPTTYVCHNKVKMDVQTDTFLREYTTKTKIETSSGGGGGRSGGGSSHHSSEGSSHGGGGRHR